MAKSKPPITTVSKSRKIVLRKKKLSSGNYSLYLDKHFGERDKEYLELYLIGDREKDRETLLLAEAIKAERILEYQADDLTSAVDRKKAKSSFLKFFEEIAKKKKQKNYDSTLYHLRNYLGTKDPTIKDITPKWLDDFKDYLKKDARTKNDAEKKLSINTAASYYERVKTVLGIAVRDNILKNNPTKKLPGISKVKSLRSYVPEEDLKKLNATAAPTEYDSCKAFMFGCFSGLRYSDIEPLKKSYFKFDPMVGPQVAKYQQKTGEPVYVQLPPQALEYLPDLDLLSDDDPVFYLPKSLHSVNEHLEKWAKLAGVTQHIHFHLSRHTFSVLMLLYGADIYTLKDFLGHTDVRTTQEYAKVVNEAKKKAAANMPRIEISAFRIPSNTLPYNGLQVRDKVKYKPRNAKAVDGVVEKLVPTDYRRIILNTNNGLSQEVIAAMCFKIIE